MPDLNEELVRDAATYADRWLEYQQRLREIPAITVAVRLRDTVILSNGHGHADLENSTPVTPEHIFRIASHSKWFTATAVMLLKEQGRLRLDDALVRFIPWLTEPLATLTVRQVLNHAAGITRDGYDNGHWQLERPFPDADQLRKLVDNGGYVLAPDRMLKYSNIGYSLLGVVIAAASGVPYNEYVRDNIVNRLGLENTGPETTPECRKRMVTGYTSRSLLLPRMPLPDVKTHAMSAATGFYSTAEDLTRYASAHFFGNDELIGDDSKREMQRPYWPVEGMDSYGLGMQVGKIGDRWMVGHSGGFPGHTTRTYLDPQDKLAVTVLTSESNGVATELVKSIVKLIDLALAQNLTVAGAKLDPYTGRFASLGGYTDIVRLGDTLFIFDPGSNDPAADAVTLEVEDADTLKIEEKEGYGSPGENIRYVRDETGNVVRVIVAGRTQHPTGPLEEYLERRREELMVLLA